MIGKSREARRVILRALIRHVVSAGVLISAPAALAQSSEPTLEELERKLQQGVAADRRRAAEAADAAARKAAARKAEETLKRERLEQERVEAATVAAERAAEAERIARQVELTIESDVACTLSLDDTEVGRLEPNTPFRWKSDPTNFRIGCISVEEPSIRFDDTVDLATGSTPKISVVLAERVFGGGCSLDYFRYRRVELAGEFDGNSRQLIWERTGSGRGVLTETIGGRTYSSEFFCNDGKIVCNDGCSSSKWFFSSLAAGATSANGKLRVARHESIRIGAQPITVAAIEGKAGLGISVRFKRLLGAPVLISQEFPKTTTVSISVTQ